MSLPVDGSGRTIRVSVRSEITNAYDVDVAKLLADAYFEDVDLTSHEAVADRFEDWMVDMGDDLRASFLSRPLAGLSEGEREVYEVDLNPEAPR